MAQVDRATREDVDQLLARAIAAWESVAETQREIAGWDLEDQLAFIEEWPLEEERLQRLAGLARADALSPGQRMLYGRLLQLVDEMRPMADQLLRV